jgi:hypothetical protein
MQKTEVYDIINTFMGPFRLILAIFWPKKWGQLFGAYFLAKNRLGPYFREDLGLVLCKKQKFLKSPTSFWGHLGRFWSFLAIFRP